MSRMVLIGVWAKCFQVGVYITPFPKNLGVRKNKFKRDIWMLKSVLKDAHKKCSRSMTSLFEIILTGAGKLHENKKWSYNADAVKLKIHNLTDTGLKKLANWLKDRSLGNEGTALWCSLESWNIIDVTSSSSIFYTHPICQKVSVHCYYGKLPLRIKLNNEISSWSSWTMLNCTSSNI